MTAVSKILKHFPKSYLIILTLLCLVMLVIGLWHDFSDPNDPSTTSKTLDLSSKITSQTTQNSSQPELQIESEKWRSATVGSGDSLSTLFKRVGLTSKDVYQVTLATKKTKALGTLFPGDTLEFLITAGQLQKVRHVKSPLQKIIITRQTAGHYTVDTIIREPEIESRFIQGSISNSLFVDGQRAGLSEKKLMQLASIFGWDIDFALDIRKEDYFAVIYEENYLDNKLIGEGNIVAAQFVNRGEIFDAIRHSDGNYYSPKGYSMRKAFLRSPVDFFRISSKYNPNRKHPVLKTTRPHRGVDYAAATGTPIKASGDGKVIWRGTKGGYGRTVILQHAGIYTTLYAHMSKYNRKVKKGSRVKQGQIIGYIGSSGLATGPHLHYEFRANGVHKNPLKVKFPNVDPLNKKQMTAFKPLTNTILGQLESYQLGTPLVATEDGNELAQASSTPSAVNKKEASSENELSQALPTKTKAEQAGTTRQATADENGLLGGLIRRWNQAQAALGDLFASESNQPTQPLSEQQNRVIDAKNVQENRVIDAKKVQAERVRQAIAGSQN